jgi:ABC-2 type transport system permease protein
VTTLARQVGIILRNDLRLFWRGLSGGKLRWLGSNGVVIALFLVFHVVSIPFFYFLHRSPPPAYEALAWGFFAFAMLGAAANQVVAVVFERADFDFLLSSPVSPRAILWARLGAIAASAFLSVGLFLMPVIDGAVIGLSPRYLAAFVVWALLALLAGSVGFWVTLVLVRWLGVRRARTVAQVVAALLGASIFVVMQLQNAVPMGERAAFWAKAGKISSALGFALIARAGRGEISALAILAAVTAAFSILTGRQLARLLVTGVQGAEESQGPRSKPAGAHRWTVGLFRAAFRKDLRLIVRDPLLLAQILPSLLYLAPALLPFWRQLQWRTLAPLGLALSSQLALSLAVVSAWGEECWDLIRMSPVPEPRIRGAKVAAAMAPAMALVALCCAGLVAAGYPGQALLTALMSAACGAGCARLAVAEIRPTPRRDLLRRGGRSGRTWRMYAGMFLTMLGSLGLGLAGAENFSARLIGVLVLGIMLLGVLACFVLVEFNAANFERA